MSDANHIVWATGGSMVSRQEMNSYYEQGKNMLNDLGRLSICEVSPQ